MSRFRGLRNWHDMRLPFLAAVLLCACADVKPITSADGGASACLGVDCGQGTCAVVGGQQPVCICAAGFFADRLSCKPVVVGAECDGVTCDNRGVCVVLAGSPNVPKCECYSQSVNAGATTCVPRPPSPCEGIDCSGHGACAVTGTTGVCLCESGYRSNGTACEAVVTGQECSGVTCSGHGVCVVVRGTPDVPSCQCDSGFTRVGQTTCVANTDPCAGITCSGQGVCGVTTAGQAVCSCNPGYRAMGSTCVPPLADGGTLAQCAGITCSNQGQCAVLANGAPGCLCNNGFYAKGVECLNAQDFACRNETCSGQGTCRLVAPTASMGPSGRCDCTVGFVSSGLSCLDPCAGQTCSNRGTCGARVSTTGVGEPIAECFCDPGYRPSGTLQCTLGCGAGCSARQYCEFSSNTCRPLPAAGIQFGQEGTRTTLNAIVSNLAGEFYVAGSVTPVSRGTDIFLKDAIVVKFSASGTELWRRVWGQSNAQDDVDALAIDSAGNVWSAGTTEFVRLAPNLFAGKGEVVKWLPDGTRAWTFKYALNGEVTTGSANAVAVGPGATPPVYLAGFVHGRFNGVGTAGSLNDAFVARVNTADAGSFAWTRVFGPVGNAFSDVANSVVVDSAGDLYVGGDITGNINGTTTFAGGTGGPCVSLLSSAASCSDGFVSKFSPDGGHQWTTLLGTNGKVDSVRGLASSGNVVVAAGSFQQSASRSDAFAAQLDNATGAVQWLTVVPGNPAVGSTVETSFRDVAVDGTGTVYAVGASNGDFDTLLNKTRSGQPTYDVVMTKWSDAGVKLTSHMWGSDDSAASESGLGAAIGVPTQALVVGTGNCASEPTGPPRCVKNLTQQGTNTSFVIFAP